MNKKFYLHHKEDTYYDEVFSNKKARPHYEEIWNFYSQLNARQRARNAQKAKVFFDHDAEVLSFPRIITSNEREIITKGILQRGKAIQLFLHDHYFGKKLYSSNKIIPKLKLDEILNRNYEKFSTSSMRPENLQFWYAPDLIRDAKGKFRVIEDNVGFVGGIGDLEAIEKASYALGIDLKIKSHPLQFYADMARYYKQQAKKYGSKEVILISYQSALRTTHEDNRLEKIFAQFNIPTVTDFSELIVDSHQLFYKGKKIGFVIINMDTADVEPQHIKTYLRYLNNGINEVHFSQQQKLKKLIYVSKLKQLHQKLSAISHTNIKSEKKIKAIKGFWDLVENGDLGVSYVPGMEFINDKEFYRFIEKIIRYYLKEEPILKNIKTYCFSQPKIFDQVFNQIDQWVIKNVLGQGGKEVWIGKKLTTKKIFHLRKLIQSSPHLYIAQRYVELSRMFDYSVDIRPFALVSKNKMILSKNLWGRAIPIKGSGKVNISSGGLLTALVTCK